jgi:lipopolysaccharide transport system permease protein
VGGVEVASVQARRQPRPLAGLIRSRELAVHLALRQLASQHRFSLLGWAWPLLRQLAQLGVLLLIFQAILDLEIENYAVFLFTGLVAWTWFSRGVQEGTEALLAQRHLLMRPRCPAGALPVVPVVAALVDALIALPILLVLVAANDGIGASALALPMLAAIQITLMLGIVWFTSAANVHFRDVSQIVAVLLTLFFYLTPVFYSLDQVPEGYRWILELNPLAVLIEGYRDVLGGQELPDLVPLLELAGASALIALAGFAFFSRRRAGLVDEL